MSQYLEFLRYINKYKTLILFNLLALQILQFKLYCNLILNDNFLISSIVLCTRSVYLVNNAVFSVLPHSLANLVTVIYTKISIMVGKIYNVCYTTYN